MAVAAIDFGSYSCKVAIGQRGGVEVVLNDYSLRQTPTYVAFSEKDRSIGVQAKQGLSINMSNTVYLFKHFIGRKFDDPTVQGELSNIPCKVVETKNGGVGFLVHYLGKETVFTPEQITAMLFTKLNTMVKNATGVEIAYCVIAIPCSWTNLQRKSLLNAAKIANIPGVHLMNETTAAGLAYGLPRARQIEEEKSRKVVFIDVGYSSTTVSVIEFIKSKLKVLAHCWDENLGGRNFDYRIREYLASEFQSKYKLNAKSAKRPWNRLLDEAEKVKKQLAMNSCDIPINLECFMEDRDVSCKMNREQFEKYCEPEFKKFENLLREISAKAKLSNAEIHSVEILGGSTRVPAIKSIIQQVYEKVPQTHLNADEAVAVGAGLQSAIYSPTTSTKTYDVEDCFPYAIKFIWPGANPSKPLLITDGISNYFPITRQVKVPSEQPYDCSLEYVEGKTFRYHEPKIGDFHVKYNMEQGGAPEVVKVKFRIDADGIVEFTTSSIERMMTEEQASEANGDVEMKDESKLGKGDAGDNTEKSDEPAAPPKAAKPKKKTILIDTDVSYPNTSSESVIQHLIEVENEMQMTDKREKEKSDAKNSLEEFVYNMRNKLDEAWREFIPDKERSEFLQKLSETENWIYGDGEDVEKSVYLSRLDDLSAVGGKVATRFDEWSARPLALEEFGKAVTQARKFITEFSNGEEKYSHLSEEDVKKVRNALDAREKELASWSTQSSKLSKQVDAPFSSQNVKSVLKDFNNLWVPIATKPRPKIEPPAAPMETDAAATDGSQESGENGAATEAKASEGMDID